MRVCECFVFLPVGRATALPSVSYAPSLQPARHDTARSSSFAGRDVIGLAQTGSGKTAAFSLPILQALLDKPQPLFALILSPTRCAGGLRSVQEGGRMKREQRLWLQAHTRSELSTVGATDACLEEESACLTLSEGHACSAVLPLSSRQEAGWMICTAPARAADVVSTMRR